MWTFRRSFRAPPGLASVADKSNGLPRTGSILKVMGDRMIRATALAAWLAAMLLLTAAAPTTANSGPSTTTFADVVARSRLVVLADVVRRPAGGITLDVARVLKGRAGRVLRFAPTLQSAVQPGWARAVVAFTDPTTLDFRAQTIAWHVTAAGVVDPPPSVLPSRDAGIVWALDPYGRQGFPPRGPAEKLPIDVVAP